MTTKMIIHKDDLLKLAGLCDIFETDQVTIVHEEGGGIGYYLYGVYDITHAQIKGTFQVEISGVDDW